MHRLFRPRLILAVLLLAGLGAAACWWRAHNRPTPTFTAVSVDVPQHSAQRHVETFEDLQ